ncbi:MAG: glucokinase [Reyranella sp.]|nr:glucokinase [Reyranella sp.]
MKRVLLADIGGTHARFAVLSGNELGLVRSLDVETHPKIHDAIRHFLAEEGSASSIDEAIFAVAGAVVSGRCALTNSSWVAEVTELRRAFGFKMVRLVNDHEAAAWGLPDLVSQDSLLVGSGMDVRGAPMALLGPGTGLGMACYVPGPTGGRVIVSEGGHMTLAATTDREVGLIGVLRRKFEHVSAERILSGPGLVNLYQAIAEIDHVKVQSRTPAEVTQAALDDTCGTCRKALDAFILFLGSVAGDIALLFGARGGVFIGGGVVPHIAHRLAATNFRDRFEAKGRFQPYLAEIPVRIVLRRDTAFLGLTALARNTAVKSDDGDHV